VADLAGFEALIRAHIEREERFVMPLLEPEGDRWTSEWRD
jgi:hemerythrin-like domain-containing protein